MKSEDNFQKIENDLGKIFHENCTYDIREKNTIESSIDEIMNNAVTQYMQTETAIKLKEFVDKNFNNERFNTMLIPGNINELPEHNLIKKMSKEINKRYVIEKGFYIFRKYSEDIILYKRFPANKFIKFYISFDDKGNGYSEKSNKKITEINQFLSEDKKMDLLAKYYGISVDFSFGGVHGSTFLNIPKPKSSDSRKHEYIIKNIREFNLWLDYMDMYREEMFEIILERYGCGVRILDTPSFSNS